MEIGIDSFAAATVSHDADAAINNMKALAELLERMEYADTVASISSALANTIAKSFWIPHPR